MLRSTKEQTDMTLTTVQKGKIMGDRELADQIAKLEK